jgi:CRISPR/Cas system CSM-associated protein Csm2 small subunit
MRNSEIRKLVSEYKETELRIKKMQNKKLLEKLGEIKHRYFHETGRTLKTDLKEIT